MGVSYERGNPVAESGPPPSVSVCVNCSRIGAGVVEITGCDVSGYLAHKDADRGSRQGRGN